MKKILFTFALLGVSLAQAKTYHFMLYEKSYVGSDELKPGEYSVELKDQQAVIKGQRSKVEAPVKVESEGSKHATTTVRYSNGDGRYKIQEIHLGGTNMKLVFN